METIYTTHYKSPVGILIIGATSNGICLCDWNIAARRIIIDRKICTNLNAKICEGSCEVLTDATRQLDEYFQGSRRDFTLPILFTGTSFQQTVRREIYKIPYGQTISYLELAIKAGNPKGVRAVAAATASNPISIIVPCHRVIGRDGKLTGYAGGLDAKKFLLNLEST